MQGKECEVCGGCPFRTLEKETYQQQQKDFFQQIIKFIKNANPIMDDPIFIEDHSRRRASLAFCYHNGSLCMGFNEEKTHSLVDIKSCPMLDSVLNNLLPKLRSFIEEFWRQDICVRGKKNKLEKKNITKGRVKILHADNGVDILIDVAQTLGIEHKLLTADFANREDEICRISWSVKKDIFETVIEKRVPELYIAGYVVQLPVDVFLQSSKAAETAMIEKVMSYMGNTEGKIADLFCGLGTFTYPLAQNKKNKIISADSSKIALDGLKNAINKNQIQNVTIIAKNLFKYPFDQEDLKDIAAIVMDPPRAGAHEQCREIAKIQDTHKPQKIIFISCNPKTFVYDANLLIDAGYTLKRITLIDQFVYTKHQELIALFIHQSYENKGE